MVPTDDQPAPGAARPATNSDIGGALDRRTSLVPRLGGYSTRNWTGLFLGPGLFLLILLIPTASGMGITAQRMAAVAALMATWWICESVPIPVTSLLPVALFPLLGVMRTAEATAPYASHLIFLFMGGFIIALSMQRWNLHRRLAMNILKRVGFSPNRLILGFMVATAVLSAFVSNTATAAMMMPIGLAIVNQLKPRVGSAFTAGSSTADTSTALGTNLMLGIAYAASIGGMATLIGTPPNTVLAGYLSRTYGYEITFVAWLKVGVPFVLVMLPLAWLWLTRVANPMRAGEVQGGASLISAELARLGPMRSGERWTAVVFGLTAAAWIFRPQWTTLLPDPGMVTDATIAMAGALVLFLIPIQLSAGRFVMDWKTASKLPWGVLILFGGGLSLAEGFKVTGLAEWIGGLVGLLEQAPVLVLILVVTTLIILLTELTSNTATAAMSMPILAAVAVGIGQNPLLLLVPAAMAASCAFMLPVATPPNAIVFGSGQITIPQMVRSGIGLNAIAVLLAVAATYCLVIPVFEVVFGTLPTWVHNAGQ